MAYNSDWLPGSRTGQLAMARNWISIIHAPGTTPPWGIPQAEVTEFVSIFNDAQAALLKAQSEAERTVVVTTQCNVAFKALTDAMRFMKAHHFLVPPLTEADIASLGLRLKDPATPIPKPEVQPEADLAFPGIHLVELRNIRPVAGGTPPDPRSDYGVRIHYGLSGDPTETHRFRVTGTPKTGRDLPDSLFTRRQKERFDFDGESGKTVYFCLQYERPTGGEEGKGPFGPILSAVIP
jgi:hypothetical protein